WKKAASSFADLAAYDPVSVVVDSGEVRRTSALRCSTNLGSVLKLKAHLGRLLNDEDSARSESVAVLCHAAWLQRFGGSGDVVGRTVMVDGRPVEIVGVTSAGSEFPDKQTELWLPLPSSSPGEGRGAGPWYVLGRLAPGVTLSQAQAELSALATTLEREFSVNTGLGVTVAPLVEHLVGRDLRKSLLLLLGAVGTVLLIACSNVANLMLARGVARQREFALRLSLGATRGRLVAQLLIENAVLCLVAAGVGLGISAVTLLAIRAAAPVNLPRLDAITIDFGVLGFALVLALVSLCAAGLRPAIECSRRDALSLLRNSGRGPSETPRARRIRSGLVVVEFALAVMLFAGAAMLVRSFVHVLDVAPGYRTANLLVAPLRLDAGRPESAAIPYAATLLERVRALPGAMAVAISDEATLGERGAEQVTPDRSALGPVASLRVPLAITAITPEYFRVMGVPLRAGRVFTDFDGPEAPPVAVVNETLARQLWPGDDPVGRTFRLGASSQQPWITVVGVAGDQRLQSLDRAPLAQVFRPWSQQPSRGMNVLVLTVPDPVTLAPSLVRAIQSIDRSVPLEQVITMEQLIDRTMETRRFRTQLLSVFAGIALVLAGVGIFGLVHYSVAQSTQEIGIRTALGASAGQILREVLASGLKLAVVGVGVGIVGAIVLARMFAALLYETGPTDPVSLFGAALALLTVALLACYLPARRAARVDPMLALRAE
ncbi:MAG: ABC transporter permease, partial [Opitutaceae bacterium]|nr:ABC transporter permease [Opitutaceae bacterium]